MFAGKRVWWLGVTLSVLVCVCREEGMVAGCNPLCASFPCHNNAECVEHWSGYTCRCENSYAHSGDNCEISEYENDFTCTPVNVTGFLKTEKSEVEN